MRHIEGERDGNPIASAASGGRIQIGLGLAAMVFPPALPWISVVFADRAVPVLAARNRTNDLQK
jgi:hypothetical protein